MKVTLRIGLIEDGEVHTSLFQDIEMPEDCHPTDIERELDAWVRSRTFASYDTHVEILPETTPDRELHPVH